MADLVIAEFLDFAALHRFWCLPLGRQILANNYSI
jgi:hypothetical protein